MRQQESSVATKASAFDITVVDEATRRTADERLGDGTLIVDHESSSQYLPYHIESDDLRNFDSEADESRCGFIPGYSILGAIGRGGMGIVYQAIQEKLQRVVALKVLTPSKAVHPDYIQRFRSEAMAVARLNHPNVVAAYDYGEAEGRFYLAIEYVEGLDGAEMLAKKGRLDELSAVCIARDTVLGLSHALSQGIIHRDIKPANLMLVDEVRKDASGGALGGVVKVTDLGLAQIRENTENECPTDRTIGVVVGTPSYMPPEQARGEHVDFRADVYALGATLYHFVTGQRPFDCKTLREALRSKQEDRLAHPQDLNPDLSDDLILVLDRMLAHKRDDRYQSYEDLLLDLQALVVGMRPATSAIPTSASSFEHRRQRSPRKTTRIKLAEDDTPEPFRLRLNLPKRHQRLRRLLGVVLAFGSGLVLGLLLR